MTWSDEVFSHRIQLARAAGSPRSAQLQGPNRRFLPPAAPPANSSLAPIALVSGLVATALYWSKEGHKLRGRRLPSVLEKLRRIWLGTPRRTVVVGGGGARRPAAVAASPSQPQQQTDEWRQQPARSLAAAAAENRLMQKQEPLQAAAVAAAPGGAGGSGGGSSKSKKKKNKSKKKR